MSVVLLTFRGRNEQTSTVEGEVQEKCFVLIIGNGERKRRVSRKERGKMETEK